MLLESVLDRVNALEAKLKQLTPSNQSSAGSYGVARPVESLLHSTTPGEHSVDARGVF